MSLRNKLRDPRQFLIWLRCILTMGKGKNSDLSILVIGGSLDDNEIDSIKMRFKIWPSLQNGIILKPIGKILDITKGSRAKKRY